MTISITDKPEMNVVNVGDEISGDQLAAIQSATNPTAINPFATIADVGGGGGSYLPLTGGTLTGDVTVEAPVGNTNYNYILIGEDVFNENGAVSIHRNDGTTRYSGVGISFDSIAWISPVQSVANFGESTYLSGGAYTLVTPTTNSIVANISKDWDSASSGVLGGYSTELGRGDFSIWANDGLGNPSNAYPEFRITVGSILSDPATGEIIQQGIEFVNAGSFTTQAYANLVSDFTPVEPDGGTPPVTNLVRVRINGVDYFLLASTSQGPI